MIWPGLGLGLDLASGCLSIISSKSLFVFVQVFLVTGGSGSNARNTEILVEGEETWTKLDGGADLPTWTWGLKLVSVDNTVLAIGC